MDENELGLKELVHPLYIENAKVAPTLESLYTRRFGKTDKKTLLWTFPLTTLRVRAACTLLKCIRRSSGIKRVDI